MTNTSRVNGLDIASFFASNYRDINTISYYTKSKEETENVFIINITIDRKTQKTDAVTGKTYTVEEYTLDYKFYTTDIVYDDIAELGKLLDSLVFQKLISFKKALMIDQLKSFLYQLNAYERG